MAINNAENANNALDKKNIAAKRGYFIVFEGGDGSGKTTQIGLLRQFFAQKSAYKDRVITTREPGGTREGEIIRDIILNRTLDSSPLQDLLLFTAARIFHIDNLIIPALKQNKIILCDRFVDSSWVYQSKEGGVSPAITQFMRQIACRKLCPDAVFILDMPAKVTKERLKSRHNAELNGSAPEGDAFETFDLAFIEQRRQYFLELARQNTELYHVIDANAQPQEVSQQILYHLEMIIKD